MKQSILHQAPITPGQAAREGIALAQQAEEPSYPLWYTERQNMPSIAFSATSVPIAHVAARTSTIKLDSAGLCAEPLATGDRRAVRHARPLPCPGGLGVLPSATTWPSPAGTTRAMTRPPTAGRSARPGRRAPKPTAPRRLAGPPRSLPPVAPLSQLAECLPR